MDITWITFGPIHNTDNQGLFSPLASVRYRIIIPAMILSQHGYRVRLSPVPHKTTLEAIKPLLTSDVVIFSKSITDLNEQLAKQAQHTGARIIFDICDNYLDDPRYGRHYNFMINLADQVVANTQAMAERIEAHTGKQAQVIGEPVEGPQGQPHFAPTDPIRLLWFGHPVNFDSLQAMIPQIFPLSQQRRLALHIVTAPHEGIIQACQQFNQQHGNQFQLHLSPWSLETTWQALHDTDMVVIPTVEHHKKYVKSPNRLVEALWAGRFVIAHPLPAYQQFAAWSWLNWDLCSGIQWAMQHPQAVLSALEASQAYIARHYSPAVIAQQWAHILGTA